MEELMKAPPAAEQTTESPAGGQSVKTRQPGRSRFLPPFFRRSGGSGIPPSAVGMDEKLLPFLPPQDFSAEQFKVLRTRILFPEEGARPRTIAVTSAELNEGKSYIAANLAISIALNRDDERILLIDCDMRLPMLHRIFGFSESAPGLSDYLSRDADISSALVKPDVVPNHSLTLLPAGTPEASPSELLSSRKMLGLIRETQERYDDRYVILDLPPPRIVSEAKMLALSCDTVIIVARYGGTRNGQLKELVALLGKENVLGIVMNYFDTGMHPAHQKHYRRYIHRKNG